MINIQEKAVTILANGVASSSYFDDGMSLLSKGTIAVGGIITVWGMVQLGTAIKDHNGAGIQGAVYGIVGGAIIGAAGLWFLTIKM